MKSTICTKIKMAERVQRKGSLTVDYSQLNSLSSVLLYDTKRRKRKQGTEYPVERIIHRRKVKQVSVNLLFALLFNRLFLSKNTFFNAHKGLNLVVLVFNFRYITEFIERL